MMTWHYNDALADQGYEVHVANSNGDMVMFTSAEVKRNDNIIVAYQVDGQPLPSYTMAAGAGRQCC